MARANVLVIVGLECDAGRSTNRVSHVTLRAVLPPLGITSLSVATSPMGSSPDLRRRHRGRTALLAALVMLAVGCADDDDGSGAPTTVAGERFALIEEGTLTVCSDIPYAPFEFEKGGEIVGIDVDLVGAIAKELDLRLRVRDTDFDRIFTSLAAEDCDLVASSVSITDDEGRTRGNDYSDSYFEVHQSLLVRATDEARYHSLADLRGRSVGVQSETTGQDFAEQHRDEFGFAITPFTGADEMFGALEVGTIDGIVQDSVINLFHARQSPDSVVTAIFDEVVEEYAFVIPKRIDGLRQAVDRALAGLRDDGTYDRILAKYLGTEALVG